MIGCGCRLDNFLKRWCRVNHLNQRTWTLTLQPYEWSFLALWPSLLRLCRRLLWVFLGPTGTIIKCLRAHSTRACPLQRMITIGMNHTTQQPIIPLIIIIVRTCEAVMVILTMLVVNRVRLSPCLQCLVLLLIPLMHQSRTVCCRRERRWRLLHHLLRLSQRNLRHITGCWYCHSRGAPTLETTLLKTALRPKRAPWPYRTILVY